jgi:hypothetical protein
MNTPPPKVDFALLAFGQGDWGFIQHAAPSAKRQCELGAGNAAAEKFAAGPRTRRYSVGHDHRRRQKESFAMGRANPTLEPTRNGCALQAPISFWAFRAQPLLAAQLQR